MKNKKRHLPYPVMAPWSDDIEFSADCSLESSVDKKNNKYILSYKVYIGNNAVEKLIKNNKAMLFMHIECTNVLFRAPFKLNSLDDIGISVGEIELSADDIFGNAEVNIMITANENIFDYKPDNLHQDYKGISCNLVKGDIIASLATYRIPLLQVYDKLRQISSIMVFKRDVKNDSGPIKVDLYDNKLIALLPNRLHDLYLELKDNKKCISILTSMLVIPVLTEGLNDIKNCWDDRGSRSEKWFNILWQKLDDMSIDLNSPETPPFTAAQMIFDLPYSRSSVELKLLLGVE